MLSVMTLTTNTELYQYHEGGRSLPWLGSLGMWNKKNLVIMKTGKTEMGWNAVMQSVIDNQ